jgi:hypothetical protein
MEVQFTPEQEARLARFASARGISPDHVLQDMVSHLPEPESEDFDRKVCPECGHRFQGHGWDGIDAHWRARHENVMPYEKAWELIRADQYDNEHVEDIEDLHIAEQRLRDLRAGRSTTHSLEEVERELGLVD